MSARLRISFAASRQFLMFLNIPCEDCTGNIQKHMYPDNPYPLIEGVAFHPLIEEVGGQKLYKIRGFGQSTP